MDKSELEKLHKIEKEMLDEFVRICELHSLHYFLIAGTLLGAVRHKGFIPWDDDLDVGMPRKDFLKFIEVAPNDLKENYFLQCDQTEEKWNRIFIKIRKRDTIFIESKQEILFRNNGIFIDIFPLDEGKKYGPFLEKIIDKYVRFVKGHIRMETGEIPFNSIHRFFRIIPLNIFIRIRDNWFKKSGQYFINYGSNYGIIKQTMPKSWYFPEKTLEFDGTNYKVPGQYDKFLIQLYGENYLELPPENKRISHDPIKISFDTRND